MIELCGVRIDHPRGGAPLLDGADLAIPAGQVALLGGASGAGGSRLCAVLVGEQIATTGRVELFGRDLRRLRRASLLRLRRRVGVVPQDLRLLDDATALDNVLLPLDIDHVPRREASLRAAEALGQVGLAAELDVRVDALSMAERQRVAIARVLVRDPAVVVADQPTCHQDPVRALGIARVLDALARAGASVLVASRDPVLWGAAAELGWRTLGLEGGKLIEVTAAPVVEDEPREIVIEADDDAIEASVDAIPNVVPFPITARSRGAC